VSSTIEGGANSAAEAAGNTAVVPHIAADRSKHKRDPERFIFFNVFNTFRDFILFPYPPIKYDN